jgi:hypothetical protein
VVRIEVVRRRWPLFGRQTTLNVAANCAPVSSISAGQQRNEQVVDARDTVYGSEGRDRGVTRWLYYGEIISDTPATARR